MERTVFRVSLTLVLVIALASVLASVALAATEMVLKGLGYPIKLGAGVGKAEELLCQK